MKILPSQILLISGLFCVLGALIIFVGIFYPVLQIELNYQLQSTNLTKIPKVIEPIDTEFGIIIPKISANAKIVANVNPFNANEYQYALTKGIAHAKGTVFPGQAGNVFLFSHSSVNFYEAQRYNSIFYLLEKLQKGDEIDIYYKKEKFIYQVTDKKIVDSQAIQYLKGNGFGKTLTLMTCWPPGTTWKRLLVLGEIKN